MTVAGALGYRRPPDFRHVEKYGFGAVAPMTVTAVEKVMALPSWHKTHDQGNRQGSCVGHGCSMERAVCNTHQNVILRIINPTRRYDPIWVWNEAKKIDEFPDTNPGDDEGTTLRAAYNVIRPRGLVKCKSMQMVQDADGYWIPKPIGDSAGPILGEGVKVTRWATTVDQMRTALASLRPMSIGVNWYSNFDNPVKVSGEWCIGISPVLGAIRGGHCICVYGASDKRQAFKLKNSWGSGYPEPWLPYKVMARLLKEDAEVALVTDR